MNDETTETAGYTKGQFGRIVGAVIPFEAWKEQTLIFRMVCALTVVAAALSTRFVPWWVAFGAAVIGLGALFAAFYRHLTRVSLLRHFFSAWRRQGIANELVGRIGYVVVFAGPEGDHAVDRSQPRQRLRQGLDFLADEARRYGREVSFEEVEEARFLIVDPPAEPSEGSVAPEAKEMLYQAGATLPCWARADEFDGFFAFVVTTWEDLRAFAVPFGRRRSMSRADRELCVCSSTDPASTFAHEVLHLFGARDLYLEGAETDRVRDEVREEIKYRLTRHVGIDDIEDSIMASFVAGRVHVDAATAFSVGWLDELAAER
ncbi:MAG: hypothetical protein AAGE94_06160 [Acidobacteriota bacterium]